MAISNNAKKILSIGLNALTEKKAEHITIKDITDISVISDILVIASGNNINQLHAMADEIQKNLNDNKIPHMSIEGYDKANWILMDYNDVIFHLFDKESRNFYDLDRLYYDAKELNLSDFN